MKEPNTIIAVYLRHEEADTAVKALAKAGLDVKNISVVGKGYHTEEKVTGVYSMGDRIKLWGAQGAMWGGLWGLLLGGLFMVVPVVGQMVVLGHLASVVVAGIEGAVLVGGLSAIGAALASIGIPDDKIVGYEAALKADSYLVMAHGSATEVDLARSVLKDSDPSRLDIYDGVSA
jgi:uncharacterized membrane protein